MNNTYYVFCTLFLFLVAWMTKNPEHKKYQQWFALVLIYINLGFAIFDDNDVVVASLGFVAAYLAAMNHYFGEFIGESK
jgi:uncharacterized membrane protein SirB2